MNKLLYISTLVLSITVYMAQAVAASQETTASCGKRLSATFKIVNKTDLKLEGFTRADQEFCDQGLNEFSSNYELSFYDKDKKLIYAKKVFLDPAIKIEETDKEGRFISSKEVVGTTARIVTMSEEEAKKFSYYSIKSLNGEEKALMKPILKVEEIKIQSGEVIDVSL